MGAAGEDEVLVAAGLVEVAGHDDGAVVGCGLAVDEALGVKGARAATAVSDELSDVAIVMADEPGEVEHFSEGQAAEVELEAGYHDVVAGLKQALGEEEKIGDELAFVEGDALDALADALLTRGDDGQHRPGIGGEKLDRLHFAAAVLIAAFDEAGSGFGVCTGLEQHDVLAGVLTADFNAAQQLGGLVAAHGANDKFELA